MTAHVILAAGGLMPPRGALVGIVALAVLAVLDRIPLRAYRPRPDDDRRSRRRQPRGWTAREHPPTTTVHRLDRPAITAGQPTRHELEDR